MMTENIVNKRGNKLLDFALIFSAIVPQFGMNMVVPAFPKIGEYFHAEESSLQFVITIYLIGYAFSVLISGVLSERFGAKQVHIWGIIIFIFSSIACTQITSFYLLLVLRFIQALCGCGITVLSRLIIQQIYPPESHIGIVTTLALAIAISPSVAPGLGGVIQDTFNWQQIFWFLAGMGGVSFLLFYYFVPSVSKRSDNTATVSSFFNELCHGIKRQAFRRYLIAVSLVSMGQIAFLANSAYPMQINMGISASRYGFLLAVIAVGFIIGTQSARVAISKYGIQKILFWAGTIALLGGVIILPANFLWPYSPWSLVIPMFIIMLSLGVVMPASQIVLLRISSAKPGYLASVFFFGQIALSTVYSMSTKIFKLDPLLLALVVAIPCLLLGGLSFYWIRSWNHLSEV